MLHIKLVKWCFRGKIIILHLGYYTVLSAEVEEIAHDQSDPGHMTDHMISEDISRGLLHTTDRIKQDITLRRRAEHLIQDALQG